MAQLVIPRILMKYRREDGFGHVVANGVVREGRSVTSGIAGNSFAIAGRIVARLSYRRLKPDERIFGDIEAVFGDQLEFLTGGERRLLGGTLHRQKVRQSVEESVVFEQTDRLLGFHCGRR